MANGGRMPFGSGGAFPLTGPDQARVGLAPQPAQQAFNTPAAGVLQGLGATPRPGGQVPQGQPQLPPQAQAQLPPQAGGMPQAAGQPQLPPQAMALGLAPQQAGAGAVNPGLIPQGPLAGLDPQKLTAMMVLQQLFGGGGPGGGIGLGGVGQFPGQGAGVSGGFPGQGVRGPLTVPNPFGGG